MFWRTFAILLICSLANGATGVAQDSQPPLIRELKDFFTTLVPVHQKEPSNKEVQALEHPLAALKDPMQRIDPLFRVPPALESRVAFWFDVYTKYTAEDYVLHHSNYPWIIYDVVDTSTIPSHINRFTRAYRAKKMVADRRATIRAALGRLSKKKDFSTLTADEARLFALLEQIPGSRKNVFREASQSLRTQLGQRDFFVGALQRSAKYLPYMEAEFIQLGVPVELTRIPFVESSFEERAYSKVGAVGVWQIMPIAAKYYLRMDPDFDERASPIKSTLVASNLLKRNFIALSNWPLAVSAYNHGVGNISKAIKKTRSTDLAEIIQKYRSASFKFASANFYTSFLAALHAEKYWEFLFSDVSIPTTPPLEFTAIELKHSLPTTKMAKKLDVKLNDLLLLNPELRRATRKGLAVPKGYLVLVPKYTKENSKVRLAKKSNPKKTAKLNRLSFISTPEKKPDQTPRAQIDLQIRHNPKM